VTHLNCSQLTRAGRGANLEGLLIQSTAKERKECREKLELCRLACRVTSCKSWRPNDKYLDMNNYEYHHSLSGGNDTSLGVDVIVWCQRRQIICCLKRENPIKKAPEGA
jgi:hypothetical protein